jgi:gas vesicle protein GvpL/GvpF
MSVLLYGLTDDGDVQVEDAGLYDRPLRAVRDGLLTAIVSDHDGGALRADAETLWRHERIVERLAASHPILPARFASILDDDAAVLEMLQARREQLTAVLAHTRGAVELALRAMWEQPPEPESQSGAEYMQARLQLRQRGREVAAELTPLDELSRSSRCQLPARPQEPLRCAYLVDRERVDDFIASVQQLDHRLSDVQILCTGPWPAYSFAQEAPA